MNTWKAINHIVLQLKRQRPSLFNNGINAFVANRVFMAIVRFHYLIGTAD